MKMCRRWKWLGIVYFTMVFWLIPSLAYAYIDPSVTTYAIQAIAGVVVALGAFFATYGRRMKKRLQVSLDMEEKEKKEKDPPLQVYRQDLREELQERQKLLLQNQKQENPNKQQPQRRWLPSILCGLALALTIEARPIISFFLANEGEFWFNLQDLIWQILILFVLLATGTCLIHFFLPGKKRLNLRLIFAALIGTVSLCAFIQNHFMSGYLPLLTGDPIDWSLYSGWNVASIALWLGVALAFGVLFFVKQNWLKGILYGLFALLICVETVLGGIELTTAEHKNKQGDIFFSREGLYETSEAGNVVVLVSDTFEGTYMNEVLERFPEYREILSDCTCYDNVSGISVFTYFSFAKLLTGQDFPMGEYDTTGMRLCFENQTIVDRVLDNGWEVQYFSDFLPSENVKTKILNCWDREMTPDFAIGWDLTKLLWSSTLFQSAPQPLKEWFLVYTTDYNALKEKAAKPGELVPYVINDPDYYNQIVSNGLTAQKNAKPRYEIVQLIGVHSPSVIDEHFNKVEYGDDVSLHERKIIAAKASLNLLREYLDALKRAGTYDQTTVIMTADHGFNMRYYPVFLVKEAGRSQDRFIVDSTPLSLQEDYENLIDTVTSGVRFSDAVAQMKVPEDRVRYALNFRSSSGYGEMTDHRSRVMIYGPAREETSYRIDRDEFLLYDEFPGRYTMNVPFITESGINHDIADVYGTDEGKLYGHSAVFSLFFETEEARKPVLDMRLENITSIPQKIIVTVDEKKIGEAVLDPGETRVQFTLPELNTSRWIIEMDVPDALQSNIPEATLEWRDYTSLIIKEATLKE